MADSSREDADSIKGFQDQITRGSDGWVVMVLIDEAHMENNARDHAKQDREFINFLTLCRKLDIYLCFITQDGNTVDKQIRRYVSIETNCRNMKDEKLFGAIEFPIPMYVRVRYKVQRPRVSPSL